MGIWETVGSAAGAFVGPIIQQQFNRRNAAEAHDWSVEDAKESRAWQERMSNTAHQREVADLREAGLNPILSATGGAGAPVGGGAMASSEAAESAAFDQAMVNAISAQKTKAEMALIKAQERMSNTAADVNKAQADKTRKEADIIGPKSFIMDKIQDWLRNTGDDVKHKWERRNGPTNDPLPKGNWRKP